MERNEWFKSWFNTQDYLDLYKHRDNKDAQRVIRLLFRNIKLPAGANVLDLACGNGRHSVLFAEKGYCTLGIDLSAHMIRKARRAYKAGFGKNLRFEIGDMRRFGHKHEFDLVVNLFSSFGYFDRKSENEKVIKSVSGSLRKGGFFCFDFFNSSYLRKKLKPFSFEKRKNETILQLRYIRSNISIKTILILDDNPAKNNKQDFRRFDERVRLFDAADFRIMFKKSGLKILKQFGDYSGNPFVRAKSERLIILAQKV